LLVTEILVGGDNGEKNLRCSGGQQFAVLQGAPQPSSKAETISWPTRKRRSGTGVP
jgi:hypothetical protein